MEFTIRRLNYNDREGWDVLWRGYQAFYNMKIPPEVSDLTWQRFHDPAEPIFALGAFADEKKMIGIVHYLFHRASTTAGPYCYLQDLFTAEAYRRNGVGRRLIEQVYVDAREAEASRVYWLTHETNETGIALYNKLADRTGFIQYRKLLG